MNDIQFNIFSTYELLLQVKYYRGDKRQLGNQQRYQSNRPLATVTGVDAIN